MSAHNYDPLRTYEVTWMTGHVEIIRDHQVTIDTPGFLGNGEKRMPAVHGMFGTHWRLVLLGRRDDLLSLGDVTDAEVIR